MKRDEINPDELDALLVAFADDQLDEPQSSEILTLISEYPDLVAKVENFKTTGAMLVDFFESDSLKTPQHIADKIRLMVSNQDQLEASATPDIRNLRNEKIVSLSAFKKLRAKLSLTPQSLTQMVAACALGLIVGPSLFNNRLELSSGIEKTPMNLRGGEKILAAPSVSPQQVISIMAQSQSGAFERAIQSGESIRLETPFVINITSPINGEVRVYEEVDGTLSGSLGGVERNPLYQGNVSKGSIIILPENGVFSLSDQESFILITEFFNYYENRRIRTIYKLK